MKIFFDIIMKLSFLGFDRGDRDFLVIETFSSWFFLIQLHLCNIQCSSSCAYNIVKYEMRNTEMNKMKNIQGHKGFNV